MLWFSQRRLLKADPEELREATRRKDLQMKDIALIRFGFAAGVAGLLCLGAPLARAQESPDQSHQASLLEKNGHFSDKDFKFAQKAARTDVLEVRAGRLAEQKSTSQAIRDFASHLVRDHMKANDKLLAISTQEGATLPPQLSREQASVLRRLEGLSGAEFDKAFVKDMVKGHTKAAKEFKKATEEVSDTDLRAWAQNVLPRLEDHLRMAKSMLAAVEK